MLFRSVLKSHGNVRHIIAGHIHRTINGSVRGIPFSIFKSPVHQQPMTFDSEDASLSVAEPGSRALLQKLVRDDLSAFPFLSFRRMDIGMAPVMVGRISFTGDLGYEIWMKPEYQRYVHALLLDAGRDAGIRHFGARALHSMRLEKSFGTWAREYRPIYGPVEAGLGRFVAWDKPDFVGRAAALEEIGRAHV